MAQESHVPKFGNWDSDNIPYTAYFESARKGKLAGHKIMNPNDPEENPDAFIGMRRTVDVDDARDQPVPPGSKLKALHGDHHRNNIANQQKINRGYTKSSTSESSSERSGSDYSLVQPYSSNRQPRISDKKKSPQLPEGSNSFALSLPGHARNKSATNPFHQRTTSIPKFGDWYERNPGSGEGFTAIFTKIKQEKQIASSNFPTVPPSPAYYNTRNQTKHETSSLRSKVCCCLGPNVRE